MIQPTDRFGALLADIATRISDYAITSDPTLSAKLKQLSGNSLELQCTGPAFIWHLKIGDGTLRAHSGPAEAPQAVIKGSLAALTSWVLPGQAGSELEFSGDSSLLMELAEIFADFSPDLSAPLNQIIGPTMTNNILNGAQVGLQILKGLGSSASETMQAKVTSGLIKRSELEDFLDSVDAMRLRVDRLAARIHNLERQSTTTNSSPTSQHDH